MGTDTEWGDAAAQGFDERPNVPPNEIETGQIQTDARFGRAPIPPPDEVFDPNTSPTFTEIWATEGLKGWQRRELLRQQDHVALMAGLGQLVAHLGGILDSSKAPPMADVLYQGTLLVPANGYITHNFTQAYNMVALANLGAASVIVQNAGPQTAGYPPLQGSGLVTVPAGMFRCFTMRGTAITIYGPVGQQIDLAVYVRPRPPMIGVAMSSGVNQLVAGQGVALSPATGLGIVTVSLAEAYNAGSMPADVGIPTGGWTTIMTTGFLAVGTWRIRMSAVYALGATETNLAFQMIAGTAVATFAGQPVNMANLPATPAANFGSSAVEAIAVVTSAGTVVMQGQAAGLAATAKAAVPGLGTANCSGWVAMRIA
jgi:hypothetical protein